MNEVRLSLKEYDELKELKRLVNENKSLVFNPFKENYFLVWSTADAVENLLKINKELEKENKNLRGNMFGGVSIEYIRQMNYREFKKWKSNFNKNK